MTAHGTDPDLIDQEVFHDICVLYNDGMIGNTGILETLGNLTAGVYNYMRSTKGKAYTLQDIIPNAYDYMYPPKSEQEKKEIASQQLLTYILMSPNAPKTLTEKQNG